MIESILDSVVSLVSSVSGVKNVTSEIGPIQTLPDFLARFPVDANGRINVWLVSRTRLVVQREAANSPRTFFNHTIRIDGFISGINGDDFNAIVDNVVETLVRNISLGLGTSVLTALPAEVQIDLVSFVNRLCYRATIEIVVREVRLVSYV